MPMPGGVTLSSIASFMATWVLMMTAMMLPPLVPALARYRGSLRGPQARLGAPTALVGAGYYLVWSAVGLAAYLAGVAVAAVERSWPGLTRFLPVATGAVLLVAGGVQLTVWKRGHLARCRDCESPPSTSAWIAWRHGLHLGMHCALCCTGFMTVLVATGMMRLGTIVVLSTAITVERAGPWPERTARALGVIILATGSLVIARAVGLV
jgi:predicted metal-binding membrane protein